MDTGASFKYLPGRSNGTIMMLLSVNLILLSFFIMLNALATRSEEKTRQAALSLQTSAQEDIPAAIEAPEETHRALRVWQARQQERLQELTRDKIQPFELLVQADDANVQASLPLGMFFADGKADFKTDGQAMLENFVSSMAGQGYVRVLVRMPEDSAVLAAQRAGQLFNSLNAAIPAGSPQPEVGFSEGEPRLMLLLTPPLDIRKAQPKPAEAR